MKSREGANDSQDAKRQKGLSPEKGNENIVTKIVEKAAPDLINTRKENPKKELWKHELIIILKKVKFDPKLMYLPESFRGARLGTCKYRKFIHFSRGRLGLNSRFNISEYHIIEENGLVRQRALYS